MIPIFDLDGTLLDSDEALVAPFLELGIEREAISFGHVVGDECDRLGVSVDAYVAAYDVSAATPFPGVPELLAALDRWAVCSNKHPTSGRAELDRLGWKPDPTLFTDAFGGPKRLGPVLDAMGLAATEVIFIGDTDHDRRCANDAGVTFAIAAWNPRATSAPGDVVLGDPLGLLEVLGR